MNEHIEGYRLSPQQRRIWSLSSVNRRSVWYACCAVLLEGDLDTNRLSTALQDVVRGHEILRTTFRRLSGMNLPIQVVAPLFAPSLTVQDANNLQDARALQDVIDMSLDVSDLGSFDPGQMPMLQASLKMLSAGRHLLLLKLPALCADRAGLEVLVRLISLAYDGASAAEEEEPLQYVVVSDWLNETLEAPETQSGNLFWRSRMPAALEASLPGEGAERPDEEFRPRALSFTLEAETAEGIEQLARRHQVNLSSVLMAAWQILLYRITGHDSLPIAMVSDGRSSGELSEVIGPLTRGLPIALTVTPDQSFSGFLARVHNALQELAVWQECFDWAALLQDKQQQSAPPFFPFAFEYHADSTVYEARGVTFRTLSSFAQTDRFKLLLSCSGGRSGIGGRLVYDTSRLPDEEVRRLAERFQVLLRSIVDDAGSPVHALNLLSADERRKILVNFNDTQVKLRAPAALHQLLEAQVARTPERTAIVFLGKTLSYRTLNARANQLARYLRRQGVTPNTTVGVFAERSLEMVIGLLGILKAGGAYVPLDAEYPRERLSYMLQDSQVRMVLTQGHLAEEIPAAGAQVLCLDTGWDALSGEDDTDLECTSEQEDLAYVLYTSGSTGRPKGVKIPHRAICNHMLWMQSVFPLGEGDCVLQKTPFSFDASVWEFYAPLLAGGRLVMARPGGHRDSTYLCDTVIAESISTLQLVPTQLRMLLDEPAFERCTSLKRVFCGGEVLTCALRDRFFESQKAELINLYGPTETTIDATFHVCSRSGGARNVPIGRPIANTSVYLLDEGLRPVPLGVIGELFIGGVGVGLGYLHNAALTQERFISDPFSDVLGACLYRTGDLGRFLSDGSIEFIGRKDQQIKLRGHRIELGEIEALLNHHPDVAASAVIAREDQPGDMRLVGYYVTRPNTMVESALLRARLKEHLPDYMIPAALQRLDALPLMPNGKLDQRALPMPDYNRSDLENQYVLPRNPIEEGVAKIWTEVLGIKQIGIHDDFFALGGHSLIGTQLTSRILKLFHVELPLRDLFAFPTVAGLAEQIVRLQTELTELTDVDLVLAELEGLSDDEARVLLDAK